MAIRQIVWTVAADCKTVSPAAPQDGGVQGEDGATQVVFDLTAAPALTDGQLTLYIECTDAVGGYDKTAPLPVTNRRIIAPVPLCWTQYGGITTLRLVGEREGVVVYTLTGRLRFASRQTAARQVDTLLRTHIQQTLDTMDVLCQQASSAVIKTENAAAQVADIHDKTLLYSEQAVRSGESAAAAAQAAKKAAQQAQQNLAAINNPDDSTIRWNGVWSGLGTANRLCPPFRQTGGVVSCYPLPDYPLTVETQHTGENRIPYPYYDFINYGSSISGSGMTFTDNGDGSITANGTPTIDAYCTLMYFGKLTGGTVGDTVMLMGCPQGGSESSYYLTLSGRCIDTGSGGTFTLEDWMLNEEWLELMIVVKAGTTLHNAVFRPYIGKGFTLTQCGKSLWDFKQNVSRVTVTTKADGTTAAYWGYAVHLPPGTYTLHTERISGSSDRYIYGCINGADGSFKGTVHTYTATKPTARTVTLDEGDVLYVYNGNSSSDENKSNEYFHGTFNVQIECGTTATPCEPYDGVRVPVGLSGTPTLIARNGYNSIYAEEGTITVTGRLDPVHILQTLMDGDT